jgi:hypothetical protein
MSKAVERLMAAQPSFHAWPDGRPANWAVPGDVLRHIAARMSSKMNSLETGAGRPPELSGRRGISAQFCVDEWSAGQA